MSCKIYKFTLTSNDNSCLVAINPYSSDDKLKYTCDQLLGGVIKRHYSLYKNLFNIIPYKNRIGQVVDFMPTLPQHVLNIQRLQYPLHYYKKFNKYYNYPIQKQIMLADKFNQRLFQEIISKHPFHTIVPNVIVGGPYSAYSPSYVQSNWPYGITSFRGGDVRTVNGIPITDMRIVIDPVPKNIQVTYNNATYNITYYFSEEISHDRTKKNHVYLVSNGALPEGDSAFCNAIRGLIREANPRFIN